MGLLRPRYRLPKSKGLIEANRGGVFSGSIDHGCAVPHPVLLVLMLLGESRPK